MMGWIDATCFLRLETAIGYLSNVEISSTFFLDINWHFLIFFCVVGSDNHLFGNRGSERGDGSAMGRAPMRPRLLTSSPSLFPV